MIYHEFKELKLSSLGFGTMRLPLIPGGGEQDIDQETLDRMVDCAIAGGVNYFDTAYPYHGGCSELAIGKSLARYPRESFYLADKFPGHQIVKGVKKLDPETIFEEQLKKCGVEYFDFYLLHNINEHSMSYYGNPENKYLDYFLEQKANGRIKHLGFSCHSAADGLEQFLQMCGDKMEFCQIQLNYLDWRHASGINVNAEYLYGELAKRNIPAVVMEPLLGGRLSKVHDHIVIKLKQRESGQSVASWAFRFAGSFPGVLTVLSGMTYMEHLQGNLRTYSPLHPLSEDEFAFLQETADLMVQYQTIPCNDCKYCMPCPYGIDIPAILLHYNKCINEGNMPRSGQEDYRRARRAFLVGYDRSVPKLRQASHCIGCNQCSPDCPQGIDIPKEMQRIDHFVERLKQDNL